MLLQLLAHWKTAISAGPGDKVSQHSQIRHYFNDLVFCADHEFYVYLLPINVLTCTQARAYCNSVAWSDLQCFSPPVIRCLSVTGYPSILLGCLNSAPVCIIYFLCTQRPSIGNQNYAPTLWLLCLCTFTLSSIQFLLLFFYCVCVHVWGCYVLYQCYMSVLYKCMCHSLSIVYLLLAWTRCPAGIVCSQSAKWQRSRQDDCSS